MVILILKQFFQTTLIHTRNSWVVVTQFRVKDTPFFLKRKVLFFEHLYQYNFFWFWVAPKYTMINKVQSFP